MSTPEARHLHFKEWARGRGQLEILRGGWRNAGPWEQCVSGCNYLEEYPDHCYSVIRIGPEVLHVHVFCDVENEVQHVLRIDGPMRWLPPSEEATRE